ncbi:MULTISPECIES: hypothetical protein [Bradyrhizobium]|uniref:hypothetical protein n=1 Tax=Bradyrhizobium TaxID=374 RepID=UPI00115FFC7B|nr:MULTISPECIES: hypothetical protein [Bradyrhizobium]MCA6099092.1 hypothetical protein [Bradyrhizobium australafricanum]MCC8971931.1 hypothetical protein [Bradyrhizobium brasilense]
MRALGYEVHVQALIAFAIFTDHAALQIFEVYPPALFLRRVGREVVLRDRRSLADSGNVLPHIGRQVVYVIGIKRIMLVAYAAALAKGRRDAQEHEA